jgi:hypothetical protein
LQYLLASTINSNCCCLSCSFNPVLVFIENGRVVDSLSNLIYSRVFDLSFIIAAPAPQESIFGDGHHIFNSIHEKPGYFFSIS